MPAEAEKRLIERLRKEVIEELAKLDLSHVGVRNGKVFLGDIAYLENLKVKLRFLEELKSKQIVRSFKEVVEEIEPRDEKVEYSALEIENDPELLMQPEPPETGAFTAAMAEVEFVPADLKKYLKKFELATLESIKSIALVQRDNHSPTRLVVNEDYLRSISLRAKASAWSVLSEIAREGQAEETEKNDFVLDYLNSNKNNPIYSRATYAPTKVIARHDGFFVPTVKLEVISEKAFETRKKRQT